MQIKIPTIFLVLFLFNQTIFSQTKKEQIEILQLKSDSLNQVIFQKNAEIKSLEEKVRSYHEKKIKDSVNCSFVKTDLLSQIQKLKSETRNNLDSIKSYKQIVKSLTFIRDFSNGIFTEDEYQYILNYFEHELINTFSDFPTKTEKSIHPNAEEYSYMVSLVGETEEMPYISFNNYNPELAGDLDNDGINEILFCVEYYTGGRILYQIYCLKVLPHNIFILFPLDLDEEESEFCNRHLDNSSIRVINEYILIPLTCWDSEGENEMTETEYYIFSNQKLFISAP